METQLQQKLSDDAQKERDRYNSLNLTERYEDTKSKYGTQSYIPQRLIEADKKYGASLYTHYREQEKKYEYLPPLRPNQYDMLDAMAPVIAISEDPELLNERITAAMVYSNVFGADLDMVYQNLDQFHEQWTGKAFMPKSGLKAALDSATLGIVSLKRNELYRQLKAKGGKDPELQKEIEYINRTISELQDNVPRAWTQEAARMGRNSLADYIGSAGRAVSQGVLQSLPYTAVAAVAGLATAGIASGPIAALGLSNAMSAFLIAGAAKAGGFGASYLMTEGNEYGDLIEQGIDHDIAVNESSWSSILQAGIEVALGDVAGITKAGLSPVVKKTIEEIADDTIRKVFVSGKAAQTGKFLMNWLKEAGGEGLEELGQSITSDTSYNRAAEEQNRRNLQVTGAIEATVAGYKDDIITKLQEALPQLPQKTLEEIASNAIGSFVQGAAVSLVMGGIPSAINTRAEIQDAQKVKAAAKMADSFEAFDKATAGSKVFDEAPPEQREEVKREYYNKYATEREEEKSAVEERLRKQRLYGNEDTTGEVYRDENGELYGEFRKEAGTDGTEGGAYRVGNPDKTDNNTNAEVTYETGTDGKVDVTGLKIAEKSEGIKDEVLQNFTNQVQQTIEYDGKTYTPVVKEAAAAKQTQQWKPATKVEAEIDSGFKKVYPKMTPAERGAAVELFKVGADFKGMSLADYRQKYFAGNMFSTEDANELAAAQNVDGIQKGATSFNPADLKAILHGSTWADFSTASHEFAHILRKQLDGDFLQEARRIYGVQSNEWTRENEEAFARDFEKYLATGKAATSKLAELFEKFKEFMRKIYGEVKDSLSAEQRKLFDDIFKEAESNRDKMAAEAGKPSPNAAKAPSEALGAAQNEKRENDTAEGVNPPVEPSIEHSSAEYSDIIADTNASLAERKKAAADLAAEVLREAAGKPDAALVSKYETAKKTEGKSETIYAGGGEIEGRWVLTEASTPTASHNEESFHKTAGFPLDVNGKSVNDRDYANDKSAQAMVVTIAQKYDGQALAYDNPVIVTKDGIVVSGNNRTMSSKLAAKNGTDGKYIDALEKRAETYGFTKEQIAEYKHPRVVFEMSEAVPYTAATFAQFNRSDKKAMSSIEAAVKASKVINRETLAEVSGVAGNYDTLAQFYNDAAAVRRVFGRLRDDGVITDYDLPMYYNEGVVSATGKEYLEGVMLGSVLSEDNLRGLSRDGVKNISAKIIKAITPLVENSALKDYSIKSDLNEAVRIAQQVALHGKGNIKNYIGQGDFFEAMPTQAELYLAAKLLGKPTEFVEFARALEKELAEAAGGQADLLAGKVESRDEILSRVMANDNKALFQEVQTADVVDIDPAQMVDKDGRRINLTDTRALTNWVREQYQGKEVTISDDGTHLKLNRKGIEASTKRRGIEQRKAYAGLDRIIEAAVYNGYENSDADHPKIERQNTYYAALRMSDNDKLYSAKIKIDIPVDKTNPNYYKDHKITKIEIAPTLSIGSSTEGSPSYQGVSAINRISLQVLNGNVKPSQIENNTLFQPTGSKKPVYDIRRNMNGRWAVDRKVGNSWQFIMQFPSKRAAQQYINQSMREYEDAQSGSLFLFQDEALADWLDNDSNIVETAMQYKSWQEFKQAYSTYALPVGVTLPENITDEWWKSLYDSAQKIKESEKQSTAQNTDTNKRTAEDFTDLLRDGERLDELAAIIDEHTSGSGLFETEDDTQQWKAEQDAITRVFSNPLWTRYNKDTLEYPAEIKKQLRSLVNSYPAQYMNGYAILTGNEEWLTNDTTLERLGRLHPAQEAEIQNWSPERLADLANSIDFKGVSEDLNNGTLKSDDPRIDEYYKVNKKLRADLQREIDTSEEVVKADIDELNYNYKNAIKLVDDLVKAEKIAAASLCRRFVKEPRPLPHLKNRQLYGIVSSGVNIEGKYRGGENGK